MRFKTPLVKEINGNLSVVSTYKEKQQEINANTLIFSYVKWGWVLGENKKEHE